ncbi:MAG: SDR family oxidoreductase [Bacilli bacterium]|jgi:short-subunit dehydrogenase
MLVNKKVLVVTGGGNGIGRSLVLNLLEKGASVAAVDINEKNLKETEKLAGDKKKYLSLHVVDITNKVAVEALPEKVISIHGAVDGIINNAGVIQPFIKINDLGYDKVNFVMDVNFFGTLYMVKSFLPYLLKRPEAHIANVSSMGGFLPVPGQSIYGASKAAVKLMTEALHSELKDTNVGVTVIFPGGVGTDIMKNSGAEGTRVEKDDGKKQKAYKLLTPEKAAEIIVQGIQKKKFRVCAGKDAKMMDFLYRLMPKKATKIIADKLG